MKSYPPVVLDICSVATLPSKGMGDIAAVVA